MRPALVALATLVVTLTGVAIATPVDVISISDERGELLRYAPSADHLIYSYRHSIYDVPVDERFASDGERLRLLSVTTSDIRVIEYLRWDGPVRREDERYVADAPPADLAELLIHVSRGAEQRLRTARWVTLLEPRFGEGVVRVRPERLGLLPALLRGLAW